MISLMLHFDFRPSDEVRPFTNHYNFSGDKNSSSDPTIVHENRCNLDKHIYTFLKRCVLQIRLRKKSYSTHIDILFN